jgi:hypothetical protein
MTPDDFRASMRAKVSNWIHKHVTSNDNLQASERKSISYLSDAKVPATLRNTVLALHTVKQDIELGDAWFKPKARKPDFRLSFAFDGAPPSRTFIYVSRCMCAVLHTPRQSPTGTVACSRGPGTRSCGRLRT